MLLHFFHGPWPARLVTLALWALAGAGALFWALALPGPAAPVAPLAQDAGPLLAPQALQRLLGVGPLAPAPASAPASRFVLHGLLAGQASGGGAALIAVDGQPPRPYRLGAALEPGLVVQALERNQVRLGPPGAASTQLLQMPFKAPP